MSTTIGRDAALMTIDRLCDVLAKQDIVAYKRLYGADTLQVAARQFKLGSVNAVMRKAVRLDETVVQMSALMKRISEDQYDGDSGVFNWARHRKERAEKELTDIFKEYGV